MKIINILFCLFLIMLIGCNSNDNDTLKNNVEQQLKSRKKRDLSQEEVQEEKIALTDQELKLFNSLVNAFTHTIEKLTDQIQGCKDNKSKCTDFFDWLSTDIQKQKELAGAFKKVYEFLEAKRQSKANGEDFDTYIKAGINCKTPKDKANNQNGQQGNQNDCDKDNKYGNGSNEIEQYFRGVAVDIFSKNGNEEIYNCLKTELLNENNHYDGLTTNWKD
ncbi:Mlp family lipoprotein [Borreliella bavariensis]|uniref:Mlp family lipoprotein n=1 Tax=Borreliella bavariensis TaxID=664662 RepID=UPI001C00078A|nr:Mlp family lipoprotein [Borreliella bavariensis]